MIKTTRLRWVEHTATMEEYKGDFRTLTVKYTGKRTQGRLRHKWEDNISNKCQYEAFA